jgi:hypothetical protein
MGPFTSTTKICRAFFYALGRVQISFPRLQRIWEIIADNLKKVGWSLGWVSAIDREGRTIWIADAHRDDGKRFVVRSDEKLTAFIELESAIRRRNSNRCTSQEAAGP